MGLKYGKVRTKHLLSEKELIFDKKCPGQPPEAYKPQKNQMKTSL